MTYLVFKADRGSTVVVDGSRYHYVAMEIVGEELRPVHLRLHGKRVIDEEHEEYVSWHDQVIPKNSAVSITLESEGHATDPQTTLPVATSLEQIEKELQALSEKLSSFQGAGSPNVKKISGSLHFQVTSPNCVHVCLKTDRDQYLQINGVWSDKKQAFAINGKTFTADANWHMRSSRIVFNDILRLGDSAKVDVKAI